MKTTLSALALTAGALAAVPATAETWGIDPTHTTLIVSWNHAGFSTQSAVFHEFDGTLDLDLDNVEALSADFSVPVTSLSTGFEVFTNDLLGPNFFNAEEYPAVTFVSTSVEQTGDKTATVTGDMTILGQTNPVTFDVVVNNVGEHPVGQFMEPYQGTWIGLTATATILRSDWGMEAFIPVGSDEITIEINTEMKQGGFEG